MNVVSIVQKLRAHLIFRIRNLIILALLSVILLAGVAVWRFAVIDELDRFARQVIFRVSPKSVVSIEVWQTASDSSRLNLNFKILDSDRDRFDELAKRLTIGDKWPSQVRIGVSQSSKDWLKGLLPLELNLTLNAETLSFGSVTLQGLVSSQTRNEYHFASGSGKLDLWVSGPTDVDLKIEDLKSVVDQASKSGELYMAPIFGEIKGLIDQIEAFSLQIVGKRVNGQVRFWSK